MAGAITEAMRGTKERPAAAAAAGTIACPNCGTANPVGAKFCNNCGTKLAGSVKCANCGYENAAEAKFCNECGNKL
jgi:membrane protease subunit (stomatin/prohibitin family)